MIRIEGLRLRLAEFCLQIDHLQAEAGRYLVVLGPSGSGKSLLLKSLAGLWTPQAGRLFCGDEEVTGLPPEKRRFGYVPQGSCLFPHLSVRDNLAYALRLQRLTRREIETRVEELAGLLRLEPLLRRRVQDLSGGEAQKVALGRALAVSSRRLLLDEPLGHLDGPQRRALRGELKTLQQRLGLTVVHVTHDVEEAEVLADEGAVLLGGRLLQNASFPDMRRQPFCAYVAALLNGVPAERADPAGCTRECFRQGRCSLLGGGRGTALGQ